MKRNKKNWTAKAIVLNNGDQIEVTIYSMYDSEEEAYEGIKRFVAHGYDIVKTWVE